MSIGREHVAATSVVCERTNRSVKNGRAEVMEALRRLSWMVVDALAQAASVPTNGKQADEQWCKQRLWRSLD